MSPDTLTLLREAVAKRQPLREYPVGATALRLVNGYGDGLEGLVLEQHGRHFVAQVFDGRWLAEKDVLLEFVKEMGGGYFIIKDRTRGASAKPEEIGTLVLIDGDPVTVVEEYGLKFSVHLNDTLNTGLFLDMRANRHKVAALAKGAKVLNLFAYTCSFGVHCRARGAAAVVNVDVSRKGLERGRVNYELNGLIPQKNEFIRADAVEYLERALKKDNRFDLIILDPPSFARYEGRAFSVMKDLPRLTAMSMQSLSPQGVLFVSTNHSEMLHSRLQDIIRAAARGRRVLGMDCLGQDVDFPGTGMMAESCLTAVLARVNI